jgi:hypothetical protein
MHSKVVCFECVKDKGLAKFICQEGSDKNCTYCKQTRNCLETDKVVDFIIECIKEYYDLISEGQLTHQSKTDIQPEHSDYIFSSFVFNDDVINPKCPQWCMLRHDFIKKFSDKKWMPKRGNLEHFTWEHFSSYVKKHKRFFFLDHDQSERDNFIGNPAALLKEKLRLCKEKGFFRLLQKGTSIYRGRKIKIDESIKNNFNFFGPPPHESAFVSNRMSPPGICYFYGADNCETAFREIYKEGIECKYLIGKFILKDNVQVIDFTKSVDIPSMFDPDQKVREQHLEMIFFYYFIKEVTMPIPQDKKINIDYIPTQVFSEYLRCYLTEIDGLKVRGIFYPCNKISGNNVALFPCIQDEYSFEELLDYQGYYEVVNWKFNEQLSLCKGNLKKRKI